MVLANGRVSVCIAAVVFREPAVASRQRIEMIDERLIMTRGMRIEEVAGGKGFGPRGNVIGDDAMAGLGQGLRDTRGAGEAIQDRCGIYFADQLQNARQQLELGTGVFDALRGGRIRRILE